MKNHFIIILLILICSVNVFSQSKILDAFDYSEKIKNATYAKRILLEEQDKGKVYYVNGVITDSDQEYESGKYYFDIIPYKKEEYLDRKKMGEEQLDMYIRLIENSCVVIFRVYVKKEDILKYDKYNFYESKHKMKKINDNTRIKSKYPILIEF